MYDFLVKKKVHSLTVLNANKSFENKDFKKLVNKIIKKNIPSNMYCYSHMYD